jgi:hypothetical protein
MKQTINPVFLLINAVGIFFYIKNASLSWAIPEERGLDPATDGVALVWGVGALPIAVLFIVLNSIWWSVASKKVLNKRPLFLCVAAWIVAIAFDFYHH